MVCGDVGPGWVLPFPAVAVEGKLPGAGRFPIVLLFAPNARNTPSPAFPTAAVPLTSVPMYFPWIRFPCPPTTFTPCRRLPEMTLHAPVHAPRNVVPVDPPIVLLSPPMETPSARLPSAAVPLAFVPMKLPETVLFVAPVPERFTP